MNFALATPALCYISRTMMILRRTLLLALVLTLGLNFSARADDGGARALIEGMAQQAIGVLGAKDRSDDQIKGKFHELLVSGFDVPAIGRFVLGRGARDITPEQNAEYIKLFEDYIVGIYANRFKEYSGETLAVTGTKPADDGVLVTSQLNRPNGAPPVGVDWKVHQDQSGQWKVVDVIIESVSMSISQRSEFASVMQQSGGRIEGLLQQLRTRTGTPVSN